MSIGWVQLDTIIGLDVGTSPTAIPISTLNGSAFDPRLIASQGRAKMLVENTGTINPSNEVSSVNPTESAMSAVRIPGGGTIASVGEESEGYPFPGPNGVSEFPTRLITNGAASVICNVTVFLRLGR